MIKGRGGLINPLFQASSPTSVSSLISTISRWKPKLLSPVPAILTIRICSWPPPVILSLTGYRKSLITVFHESSRGVATIACLVTLTFVMLILAPTVAAAQEAVAEANNVALIAGSEEHQLSTAIAQVKRTLEGG